MPKEVEISLRVPNMKNRVLDENGYPLDHSQVRFKKIITVEAIPKPGETLTLTAGTGKPFDVKTVRSDWNDDRGLFVVACQWATRSITAEEYQALVGDPQWELKPLI